jgi:uncharacterized protein (TIGR03663 family)
MAKSQTANRPGPKRKPSLASQKQTAVEETKTLGGEVSQQFWIIASGSIMAVATLLRVYNLTVKPLHHDEGVNGFFLTRLVREGIYQYDPANYHGPSIYYVARAVTFVLGLNTFAIRLVTVTFGIATILLALCLRRYIGSIGALTAAALIAISPGAVYLSRYFIHESLVVFFTFGLIVAVLKYYDSAEREEENRTAGLVALIAGVVLVVSSLVAVYKPQTFRGALLFIILGAIVVVQSLWKYDGKRSIYLLLAAISAGMLFASKETALVSVIVLGIALTTTAVYFRFRQDLTGGSKKKRRAVGGDERWLPTAIEKLGGISHIGIAVLVSFAVFVFINVLFYSSFFTNTKGVADSLQTFMIWAKTGKQEHVHPIYQHAYWLILMEAPVVMLGLIGAFLAVMFAKNRFALFAAQWAFGLLAAYSIVPYKTPWLALNFIVPLAVIGGYGVNELYSWGREKEQWFVYLMVVGLLAISAYQTIRLNFYHYDDEKFVYVYGHTYREFLPMVDEINRIAQQTGLREEIGIAVLSPDYWPLPWYLNDYKRIGYFGKVAPTNSELIIINTTQEIDLASTIQGRYRRVNSYPLRPGVMLVLYARNDLPLK